MKLKTHNIFTIGILTAVGSFFTNPVASLISADILSLTANQIIDSLGHKANAQGYLVRTPFTHTIVRSVLWSLIPAVVLFLLLGSLGKLPVLHLNGHQPYWILLQGILAGPLHMCLDMITEGGIFRRKNGRFQRFAVAHIKYNNIFWNIFFQLIGIGLVFLIFFIHGLIGGHYGWFI